MSNLLHRSASERRPHMKEYDKAPFAKHTDNCTILVGRQTARADLDYVSEISAASGGTRTRLLLFRKHLRTASSIVSTDTMTPHTIPTISRAERSDAFDDDCPPGGGSEEGVGSSLQKTSAKQRSFFGQSESTPFGHLIVHADDDTKSLPQNCESSPSSGDADGDSGTDGEGFVLGGGDSGTDAEGFVVGDGDRATDGEGVVVGDGCGG